MIAIYNREHLAIALWNEAEATFAREQLHLRGLDYEPESWEDADPMAREEYIQRADRIVADCLTQAKALSA